MSADRPGKKSNDTVGSLLKDIAVYLTESLHGLRLADKRHWGPDEFEQIRALEDALDDAKADFQELGVLVNGQFYYEGDRTRKYMMIMVYLDISSLSYCSHTQQVTRMFPLRSHHVA